MSESERDAGFQIFRAKDAPGLMEAKCMTVEPYTPTQRAGVSKLVEAGYLDGEEIQVLCQLPGFSLTHAWLKEGYALPLHTHDSDCLYFIVSGTLRLGTEELGPRDTFFVPAGVPYSYKPGPQGVEVLEIRHDSNFNFLNLAKNEAFWDKALEATAKHNKAWKTAKRPPLNV